MTDVELNDGKVAADRAEQPAAGANETSAARALTAIETESFGRTLAIARTARGLSQAEVASQLRLRLRQVRAIESENLADLPEGPFVRGFVRNYAKLLNLPAEPLMASLTAKVKPIEPLPSDAIGASAASPVRLAAREHASRVTVVGGAMLMLAVFAMLGWWTMRPSQVPTTVATSPAVSPAGTVPAATPAPAAAPAPEVSAPPVATAVPESPTATPPATDVTATPRTTLRFSFRDRSWVEVRQADGSVLMSRNNDAGAQEILDGVPPYTVVIGNASKVDLEFRGKPVDLAAVASSADVARLRLE